ncbi:galactose oxidase [Mycena floridula]|nr:galactose oxidase [Mycena floridula]
MAKKKNAAPVKVKAQKKAKAAQKVERKEQKKKGKSKDADDESDDDLEGILEKMRQEYEEAHKVTEELVEPPSRRANATLTACPNGNHLWFIGGELFSDDGKAFFYNDVYRYTPEKDEWRKFVCPTCPGPRSAHATVASAIGGGKIFLFGGEFSSLRQTTFHHYRDFWCFDISTHSWDRIDTKIRPSARSGHRMAIWKQYIVLFGGFYDPGITTRYLNDLWVFDTQEYHWKLIELKENEPRPSPRSGFSFLSTPEGIILHGGYCKEYAKGKRPVGIMLEDTWLLKMTIETPTETPTGKSKTVDPLKVKWERRKRPSTAYAPSLRSGCTMTAWITKNTGVMFGGVTDEDNHEETLDSTFWNDLNGYQWAGKGKWVSMPLRRPKTTGAQKKKPVQQSDDQQSGPAITPGKPDNELDPDDPNLTIPLPRYNTMLAVLRNTLYLYGGIYERGSREYTLDDFYALQLDKMDRYICLKESGITIAGDDESSSDDEDDDDDEDSDETGASDDDRDDEDAAAPEPVPVTPVEGSEDSESNEPALTSDKEDFRAKATAFLGVAKDSTARSAADILKTPLPGETLAMFYARSREYWAQAAHATSDNRGKQLRRDGFSMAQSAYTEYQPILKEVEKILMESGLDKEEMRNGAAAAAAGPSGQSRNRR